MLQSGLFKHPTLKADHEDDSSSEEEKLEDGLQKTYNESVSDAVSSDTDDPMGSAIYESLANALDHWFCNIHSDLKTGQTPD